MQKYTYIDYLRYQSESLGVREEENQYIIEKPKKQKHDKIFKEILDNKREGAKIISKESDYKILESEIEKYNRKFVLPELENRESDIIYKLKDKPVFFLIEHQTKVDYSMPFRMLEYSMEIIKSAITKEKMKSSKEMFPVVIPIVLYTGRENWKVPITFEERQYKSKSQNLQFKYNLVDGSKMSKEELMREESILSKAILLEKLDKPEEILETLKEVTTKDLDSDEKYFINLILKYLLPEKLSKEKTKGILENLKRREDDTMFIDILRKYFDDKEEKAVQTAVNEGIKKVVKEMLRKNIDEKTVIEVTKITDQELKEIKAAMC